MTNCVPVGVAMFAGDQRMTPVVSWLEGPPRFSLNGEAPRVTHVGIYLGDWLWTRVPLDDARSFLTDDPGRQQCYYRWLAVELLRVTADRRRHQLAPLHELDAVEQHLQQVICDQPGAGIDREAYLAAQSQQLEELIQRRKNKLPAWLRYLACREPTFA